jgi:archaellum component FlaG (FlaF/FlaG flagellin family)
MENFAITLVCIALLITCAGSLSMAALNGVNTMSDALRQEEVVSSDMINTSIVCENATTSPGGGSVTLYVANTGNTSLANYAAWDVIVRYQGGDTRWIPYSSTATPGWTSGAFFFPGQSGNIRARYFDPG